MDLEQNEGVSTAKAFHRLGLESDLRSYSKAVDALRIETGWDKVRLVSNNPRKVKAFESGGIEVVERIEPLLKVSQWALRHIRDKEKNLGHIKYENLEVGL